MAKYKAKDGCTISDEEIGRLGEACDDGDYPGEPGEWIVRPQEAKGCQAKQALQCAVLEDPLMRGGARDRTS